MANPYETSVPMDGYPLSSVEICGEADVMPDLVRMPAFANHYGDRHLFSDASFDVTDGCYL